MKYPQKATKIKQAARTYDAHVPITNSILTISKNVHGDKVHKYN